MNILLIEADKVIRDHVKVGLECFQDTHVEVAEGFSAINRARQNSYDYIVIGHESGVLDGLAEIESLREFDQETAVILVTSARNAKQISGDRSRLGIYSCLNRPIEEREFFRLVARMRERATAKA